MPKWREAVSPKDSMLDGFMKGLGKKLGTRRREVHQAIQRFNEELNQDEPGKGVPGKDSAPATATATATVIATATVAPKTTDAEGTASLEPASAEETKPSV
jgi:hypothetical protein